MAAVEASGKAAERAALAEIAEIGGAAVDRLDAGDDPDGQSLFARIVESWDGETDDVRRAAYALGRRADPHRVDVEPWPHSAGRWWTWSSTPRSRPGSSRGDGARRALHVREDPIGTALDHGGAP